MKRWQSAMARRLDSRITGMVSLKWTQPADVPYFFDALRITWASSAMLGRVYERSQTSIREELSDLTLLQRVLDLERLPLQLGEGNGALDGVLVDVLALLPNHHGILDAQAADA